MTPLQAVQEPASEFDVDAGSPVATGEELGPRDDDVLPDSLADSIEEAAKATAEAILRGNSRTQVEIHLPEFWDPISGPIFPNRGDQDRFWRMTRRFMEQLATSLGSPSGLRAVYPDAGVAAMLSHQWPDRPFTIASLNDRRPVQVEDEVVVVACPDPPGADDCMKLVRLVAQQDEEAGALQRPIVLFNQRMSSGDVGLGLNARRIRGNFLKPFVVTYSLRPIGDIGSVFRRYPGMWKVFLEEETMPGRYRLIQESAARPQGEELDYLVQQALNPSAAQPGPDGEPRKASFLEQLRTTMNSVNYFMKSLRN